MFKPESSVPMRELVVKWILYFTMHIVYYVVLIAISKYCHNQLFTGVLFEIFNLISTFTPLVDGPKSFSLEQTVALSCLKAMQSV